MATGSMRSTLPGPLASLKVTDACQTVAKNINPTQHWTSTYKNIVETTTEKGRIVGDLQDVKIPRDGQDIQLSIDKRLQYSAYRALEKAVEKLQKDVEKLKDKQRSFSNGNGND